LREVDERQQQFGLAGGIAAILVYAAYLLAQGGDVRLPIVDELETWIAYYPSMTLRDLFAPHGATIPALANAPRVNFGSEFNLLILSHVLLPPLLAYALVDTAAKLTGFCGMYLLLRRDFGARDPLIAAAASLVFAFAIVHHFVLFSVLAAPLLAHAWLCILRGEDRPWHVATIFAYPFLCSIPFGFASYLLLFALLAWWTVRTRKFSLRAFLLLGGVAILAVLVEWRLFAEQFFSPTFVFHRSEYANDYSFDTALATFFGSLAGAGHEASIRPLPFMAATVLSYTLLTTWRRPVDWRPFLIMAAGVAVFFVAAFANHPLFVLIIDRALGLGGFAFERIYYLGAGIFTAAFALALFGVAQKLPGPSWLRRGAPLALAGLQFAWLLSLSPPVLDRRIGAPSFAEFYAVDAFDEIAEAIGMPRSEARLLSLGIFPAIANYNGFPTADGYFSLYELSYKDAFRRMIAGELAKSEPLRRSYDEWGNRLYVPAVEIGEWPYLNRALRAHPGVMVDLDMRAASALGARYLVSAVPIRNADALSLDHMRTVDSEGLYRLHLYRIATQ
jgi:hypothetical protein